MVLTPHYYKSRMDHTALAAHYTAIADRSAIPIILYNVPAFTGLDLTARTIMELAQHPNIVGIKDSSGNVVKIGEVTGEVGDRFQFLAGSGSFFLPALTVGAVGGVMALASLAADLLAEMTRSHERGQLDQARTIQIRLLPVNAAVTTRFGIPGLKAALDLVGFYGGPVRSPLLSLDPNQKQEVDVVLRKAGILEA
jgi:4-hydroxy-2-oxoglutarate aldolase